MIPQSNTTLKISVADIAMSGMKRAILIAALRVNSINPPAVLASESVCGFVVEMLEKFRRFVYSVTNGQTIPCDVFKRVDNVCPCCSLYGEIPSAPGVINPASQVVSL